MTNLENTEKHYQNFSKSNFMSKLAKKPQFTNKQGVLLLLPPFLLGTTSVVFKLLANLLGAVGGYLSGFLFYWIFWCGLIPLQLIGSKELKDIFKESENRLGNPKWVGILFLAGPVVSPFITMFLTRIGEANWEIILVSALFAISNGTMEEVFWRGSFIKTFPKRWLWSYLYPSLWFGYWHLSPQIIFPSNMFGGPIAFATLSVFMGLTFGWVSKKTGSIRYTTIAHILTDFMGLAGFAFMGVGY